LEINDINHGSSNRQTETSNALRDSVSSDLFESRNKFGVNFSRYSKLTNSNKDSISDEEKLKIFKTLGRVSNKDDGKIIKDENEEIIHVKLSDYKILLRAAGGWFPFFFLQVIMIGFTWCKIQTDYTIGEWAKLKTEEEQKSLFKYFTYLSFSYASGTGLFVAMRCMIIFWMSIKSSRSMHENMISKVINAPINTFFDVTPTGTIMNRFSKDLSVMDNEIAFAFGGINVMLY
jgi:ABC-type multidrug transport system fused ATPase/permease subunit